ncbi:MAG: SRPBCC family protein, partial [Anaerolineae bacterium]|nr:SRPBCC family protein [Anaerolineae bacterium]
MTLIDQRVVIDAPPHIVWDFISDPAQIKRWHTGYRNISVLTTQ